MRRSILSMLTIIARVDLAITRRLSYVGYGYFWVGKVSHEGGEQLQKIALLSQQRVKSGVLAPQQLHRPQHVFTCCREEQAIRSFSAKVFSCESV
jgi:hypothetical protein